MLKTLANNLLSVSGEEVDCSVYKSCGACIAKEGCGYCAKIGECISGGWFGPLDNTCALKNYYYSQCHLSTLPLGIIAIVLISVAVLIAIVGVAVLCCCMCCDCGQDDTDENQEERPLLPGKKPRRTSYYQWNKPPHPQNEIKKRSRQIAVAEDSSKIASQTEPSSNLAGESSQDWEDRRDALLKKYARESVTSAD